MKNKLSKLKSSNNLLTEENTRRNFHFPIINSKNNNQLINYNLNKQNLENIKSSNILKTQIFENEKSPQIKIFHKKDFLRNYYEEINRNSSEHKTGTKKKIAIDSKNQLSNLLNKLINIKHKIRKINFRNTSKLNFTSSNNNNIPNFNNINQITERANTKPNLNSFYNSPIHLKKERIKSHKNLLDNKSKEKIIKKRKINVKLNSKKNILNYNYKYIFEENKKFQGSLKSNKLNNFLIKYKKAIDRNREEEIFHYKNMVLPETTIEKLIHLKNSLTLQKFKNEYYETIIKP